ncbi:hypothetical protein [uncultured Phocaeicola sp.]|uniref:hypothetical protein n=1 Tax=uncultured Phocaeicola sp. TaxID=990718 RepID=UPI0025D81BE5|nr:hypothetical protein [uncultured Phocaeicola sp.]
MNWEELKKRVIAEYDSRNLKSNVRYSALEKIDAFQAKEHTLKVTCVLCYL